MTQVQNTQQRQAPQAGPEPTGKTPPAPDAPQTFADALKKGKEAPPKGKGEGAAALGEKGRDPALFSLKDSPFAVSRGHTQKPGNKEAGYREPMGREPLDREPGKKTMPDGDALLASLGGLQPQPQVRTGETQASQAVQGLDATLTDKLVDRILVSSPESGQAEVRIALKDDLLPGTEVRIQRAQDGSVSVQFVTDNPAAERMLGKEQLTSLQNALGQTLHTEVKVHTVRTDGSMSSEADSGGQQNPGGGQGQDQGDSRQRSRQYDIFDEEPV